MPRARRPNHRLVKTHRNYTVEEAAALFGVHRNTVREWIKRGLPALTSQRPTLIVGRELRSFLAARRAGAKRPCQPGQMYCMRCRGPQVPLGNMADYAVLPNGQGNLKGLCPDCGAVMNRRVNPTNLAVVGGNLDISHPLAESHIGDTPEPLVNSDFA